MIRRSTWLVTLVLAILSVPLASAHASLSYSEHTTSDGERYILISGEFAAGDDLNDFTVVVGSKQSATVVFNSPGGHLLKAMELGRLIRDLELDTMQIKDLSCASACSLAFMGGVNRFAEPGAIGVHSFSYPGATDPHIAIAAVQNMTAEVIAYMIEMGVDPALLQLVFKYKNDDMRYLSISEMQEHRVVNVPPPPSGFEFVRPFSVPPLETTRQRKPIQEGLRPEGPRRQEDFRTKPIQDRHPSLSLQDTYIQIKSFKKLQDAEAFIQSSRMPLSIYLAGNGWYAITMRDKYALDTAKQLVKTLIGLEEIPGDSFVTPGKTYTVMVCCDDPIQAEKPGSSKSQKSSLSEDAR